MSHPSTAREALIVEAIGDVAKLVKQVEAASAGLNNSAQALKAASAALGDELAGFERCIAALTENAKVQTVKHIAARTDEAARRSIDQQSRAMADAARVAFGAELGATMQRLHAQLRPLFDERSRRWERWLTHAAVATVAAAVTSVVTLYVLGR
jgi:hypothetical protein